MIGIFQEISFVHQSTSALGFIHHQCKGEALSQEVLSQLLTLLSLQEAEALRLFEALKRGHCFSDRFAGG